jgi:hypothetical protein
MCRLSCRPCGGGAGAGGVGRGAMAGCRRPTPCTTTRGGTAGNRAGHLSVALRHLSRRLQPRWSLGACLGHGRAAQRARRPAQLPPPRPPALQLLSPPQRSPTHLPCCLLACSSSRAASCGCGGRGAAFRAPDRSRPAERSPDPHRSAPRTFPQAQKGSWRRSALLARGPSSSSFFTTLLFRSISNPKSPCCFGGVFVRGSAQARDHCKPEQRHRQVRPTASWALIQGADAAGRTRGRVQC